MELDENLLFREATIRICSSLELDKAIHDTFTALAHEQAGRALWPAAPGGLSPLVSPEKS